MNKPTSTHINTLEDDLLAVYRELALLQEQIAQISAVDYFPEVEDIEDG